jgi:uncharacterized protein (TIGR03083 family)
VPLSPRYEHPPIVVISGELDDQLAPATRQRRRFEALLGDLSEEQWKTASRCDGWTVYDVAAHLVGVNAFWSASLAAGLAGRPTRVLGAFDPVTTPELMVAQMRGLTRSEVLDQLAQTNDAFLSAIAELDDGDWSMLAEAPPGHLPIRLMVQHALWDCWIHERDIAFPVGVTTPVEPDEVWSCLGYAAALNAALALGAGHQVTGQFALRSTNPAIWWSLEVAGTVTLTFHGEGSPPTAPCLEGDCVALIEALSLRAPFPDRVPVEWQPILDGFSDLFSSADDSR